MCPTTECLLYFFSIENHLFFFSFNLFSSEKLSILLTQTYSWKLLFDVCKKIVIYRGLSVSMMWLKEKITRWKLICLPLLLDPPALLSASISMSESCDNLRGRSLKSVVFSGTLVSKFSSLKLVLPGTILVLYFSYISFSSRLKLSLIDASLFRLKWHKEDDKTFLRKNLRIFWKKFKIFKN